MNTLKGCILAGVGGAVGTALRYAVSISGMVAHATFIVNMIGCLLVGILTGICETRYALSREMRALAITGFCGGLTTYSAFSYDMFEMIETGHSYQISGYLLASLLAGPWLVLKGIDIVKRLKQSQDDN